MPLILSKCEERAFRKLEQKEVSDNSKSKRNESRIMAAGFWGKWKKIKGTGGLDHWSSTYGNILQ